MPSSSTLRFAGVARLVLRAKRILRDRCATHLSNDSRASLFVHCDRQSEDSDALSVLLTGRSCNAGDRYSTSSDRMNVDYPTMLEDNDSADFHLLQPSEPAESVRSVSPVPSMVSSMNVVTDESDNDDDTPALILERDNSSVPSESDIDEGGFYSYYPCHSFSSLKAVCGNDEVLVEETMPYLRVEDVDLSDAAAAAFKWLQRDECSPLTA